MTRPGAAQRFISSQPSLVVLSRFYFCGDFWQKLVLTVFVIAQILLLKRMFWLVEVKSYEELQRFSRFFWGCWENDKVRPPNNNKRLSPKLLEAFSEVVGGLEIRFFDTSDRLRYVDISYYWLFFINCLFLPIDEPHLSLLGAPVVGSCNRILHLQPELTGMGVTANCALSVHKTFKL